MTGIPDPGAPSGYFAALERATPIVQVADGVPTTTSMRIANGTDVQHKNVLELVRNNVADFEEFGLVAYQTRPRPEGQHGGGDVVVAILNEEHATLLLTYMRNSDVVRDFKRRLVREFYAMRKQLAAPQTREERLALAIMDAQQVIAEKDERIAELSSSVVALAPPAAAYQELVEAAGDYSVADAAKVLTRDPQITIRERALFAYMAGLEWVYRRDGRWKAYRSQLDTGRLAEKVGKPFYHAGRDELINGEPTVRITPKGLAELHSRLGGTGQQLALAAVAE